MSGWRGWAVACAINPAKAARFERPAIKCMILCMILLPRLRSPDSKIAGQPTPDVHSIPRASTQEARVQACYGKGQVEPKSRNVLLRRGGYRIRCDRLACLRVL